VFGNYKLYVKATKNKALMEKFGRAPEDWWEKNWFSRGIGLGPFVLLPLSQASLGYWLYGFHGVLAGLALSGLLLLWTIMSGGIINGLGHSSHKKDERTLDYSKDLPWWLTFIFIGEEAHHAHHAHAASWRIGRIDLGAVYIQILLWLKLAYEGRAARSQ
jgi:fatty-acid desaturase